MGKKIKEPVPPKEPPDPEGGKSWSDSINALLAEISKRFPNVERRDGRMLDEVTLLVEPAGIVELAGFLKNNGDLDFNCCRVVTGNDKVNRFEVVYGLAHLPKVGESPDQYFESISIAVLINDRENPTMPSLYDLWPSVEYQEREIFDLVGIEFEGHPDLRRILLEDNFVGHPLRKDYPLTGRWEDMQEIDAYLDENQIKIMKEAAGEEFNPEKDVPPSFKR